ncbi:Regulator of chromosome condensation [Ceratocystis fimbriata CBS 114723]|uniref:Regulator of chromosome condensation n=1 Tax=Ceratocystis fimbriata CBS 114723 TaxID=1035309 RepID=A0A2C5X737_9PEZI|nr:Regulator of chromosome condensation [Ceratocystis fimbriata CBS 114723]
MRLFVAGHNAWEQLVFVIDGPTQQKSKGRYLTEPVDVESFTAALDSVGSLEVICARLTYTLISKDNAFLLAGCPPKGPTLLNEEALKQLAVVHDNGRDFHILKASLTLGDLCETSSPPREFHSPGYIVKQISAYDAGLIILLQNSSVWVYGDSRYPNCFGGGSSALPFVSDPPTLPTSPPEFNVRTLHNVAALDDLPTGRIKKVDAGGYTLAALTEGGDVYSWGGRPGQKPYIEDLWAEPMPLDLDSDVLDIALGNSHIVILTTAGEVMGRGCNRNGQLGRKPDDSMWLDDWTKLDIGLNASEKPISVNAGPYTSFVVTENMP